MAKKISQNNLQVKMRRLPLVESPYTPKAAEISKNTSVMEKILSLPVVEKCYCKKFFAKHAFDF